MRVSNVLRSLSNYIEYPELFYLRPKGVSASHYLKYGQRWIRDMGLLTIFDVGANIGQSAIAFNVLFPEAEIYSFEPIPQCYQIMASRTKSIPKIHLFNMGLGEVSTEADFALNEFSGSSSFLPLTDAHKEIYEYAKNTTTIKAVVKRLDDIAPALDAKPPIMMKIDVQGFEDKVIKGGQKTVEKSSVVIVETSFRHLYDQQPLFQDVYNSLNKLGFEYRGALENMYEPKTGEILQSDSLFVRSTR
jgi:FkbM family methyltransferase